MQANREKHKEVIGRNPNCDKCPLHQTSCVGDKKLVCLWGTGSESANLMFVGEAPGKDDIINEQPFVGDAGKVFNRYIKEAGINRDAIYVSNATKCRPPKNRTPVPKEWKACAPYLDYEISVVKPKVICLLGAVAMKRVLGIDGITKHRGEVFWSEQYNCWCVPTWHPSYLLRNPNDIDTAEQFLRDLRYAQHVATTGVTGKLGTEVTVADTKEKLQTLISQLKQQKLVSVDTETFGTFISGDITMVSFSWKAGTGHVLPLYRTFPDKVCTVCEGKGKVKVQKGKPMEVCNACKGNKKFVYEPEKIWDPETEKYIWTELKGILENEEIKKIGQNLKYDYKFFKKQKNIKLKGVVFDTLLAHYLLDENAKGQHGLDALALKYTDMGHYTYELYQALNLKSSESVGPDTYAHAPFDVLCTYAAKDADCAYRVFCVLFKQIKAQGLRPLLMKLMIPLSFVLADMEIVGIGVDVEYYKKLAEEYRTKIIEAEAELNNFPEVKMLARQQGKPVNFGSPPQLAVLFYDIIGLPIVKYTASKKRKNKGNENPSTDKEVLEKLSDRHPILNLIRRLRELKKFLNTYIEPMMSLVAEDGRLHTTYTLDVTTTGRTSSREPNLQNIPKRGEQAKQLRMGITAALGYKLLEDDYGQIEFRHLIDVSGDEQGFKELVANMDIHKLVASEAFNIKYDEVPKPIRDKTKQINYSVIYGKSKENLAKETGLTVAQVERVFATIFKRYPRIRTWMDRTAKTAETVGEVKNWIGRKRRLANGFRSSVEVVRAEATRQAINSPIQGGASDILSIATIRVATRLEKENLKSRLVMTIHDALVVEVADGEEEYVKNLVREEMERPIGNLRVPMVVDQAIGVRFGEMEDIKV